MFEWAFMNIKKALFIILVLFLNVPCLHARPSFDVLLDPLIGRQKQTIDTSFDTSSGTTSMTRESISSFTPLWHNATTELGFGASAKLMTLGEELTLPTTGDTLSDTFSELNFGPTVRHKFQNGWILGFSALAGSASNQPFDGYNTVDIMGNAALLVPANAGTMWVFFLNYSNNRDFLRHVPIPGFGYLFNKDWGRGMIGVPAFYLQLLPRSKVNFTLRYYPIMRTYADIGLSTSEKVRFATYFQWSDDHYWRTNREIDNAQIFFVEKTLGASASFKLHKDIDLKISGGWRFNRYIFEGHSIFKDTDYNRINLDSTPFGGAEISVKID